MEPQQFKTNIKCPACVAKVTSALNDTVGEGKWHVDLASPERILTVKADIPEAKIKDALQMAGYRAESY